MSLRDTAAEEGGTGEKAALDSTELFVLLDREFQRRKPASCDACYVQLPYPVFHGGEPGWDVILPPACAHGCRDVMEELIDRLKRRYALRHGGRAGR